MIDINDTDIYVSDIWFYWCWRVSNLNSTKLEKKRKSMRHFMGMRHFMLHFMRHLVEDQLSFIFNRSSAENP